MRNTCWLSFKQRNFNFTIIIIVATILVWTSANINASPCQPEWVEWKKMCYILKQDTMNWNDSQTDCRKSQSNLASIHSQDENIFVKSLLKKAGLEKWVWIGLNDIETEGQLSWVDQSPLGFTNISNPVQNSRSFNCFAISLKQQVYRWKIQSCFDWNRSLCKYVPQDIQEEPSTQGYYDRQQLYSILQNKLLLNHVVKKKLTPSLLHCTYLCLKETRCMSLNYKTPQKPQTEKGLCRLNSATAEEFPEDFVDNSDFVYALPIKSE